MFVAARRQISFTCAKCNGENYVTPNVICADVRQQCKCLRGIVCVDAGKALISCDEDSTESVFYLPVTSMYHSIDG
jgi:hypothetical protein